MTSLGIVLAFLAVSPPPRPPRANLDLVRGPVRKGPGLTRLLARA
jgi:hypothetical protein